MELSKDRLIILTMSVISIIIFLLIAYDPLDILNLDQKVILVVIISPVLLLLLSYQRQRIIKKKETKNKMEISLKDSLTILAMSFTGMIMILLIAYDPLDILDLNQIIMLVVIISAVSLPLLLYQRQRIIKKMKKAT